MENEQLLEKYGLFNARVPRFTSYPPATRFETGTGQRQQASWLSGIRPAEQLSLYVHIPFCRRLCWFCACRTQGTKTLRPVADYVDVLLEELNAVRALLPRDVSLARLHLGGGTPTLLPGALMDQLVQGIFHEFPSAQGFEFSVEIDPISAADDTLLSLASWGLNRASIGVQDFDPEVQEAIGRPQGFDVTEKVVRKLRQMGVGSINLDFLYGLPHQTAATITNTLERVLSLNPDRLALYGYAHVPHVSKRQVMIDADELPAPRERYALASLAADKLIDAGYQQIGIDHFAKPDDGLATAAQEGRLRRNFQGYTDDPCETLLGFGASAISQFREGYTQNAVATAAYKERIRKGGLAGHRGYEFTNHDRAVAAMVQDLMCCNSFDLKSTCQRFPSDRKVAEKLAQQLEAQFPDALSCSNGEVTIRPEAKSLTRIIAAALSEGEGMQTGSLAI